jgi:hypothetical protein
MCDNILYSAYDCAFCEKPVEFRSRSYLTPLPGQCIRSGGHANLEKKIDEDGKIRYRVCVSCYNKYARQER